MADIPTPDSSFPENPQGSPTNSSINNLSSEAQKLRFSIEDLTKTFRDKKEASDATTPENSGQMLECLKEIKNHVHSLLILQKESSAMAEDERRRVESEIPDSSSGSVGEGGKSVKETKAPSITGKGSNFLEIGKGIFYIAASVVALGLGLKLMKDVGLAEIVKTFVMLAALGTGLLIFSKLGNGEDMQKTAISMIILAGAIAALALSLRLVDGVKWSSLIKGTFAVILFGGALGILSKMFGGDSMIKVAASMIVLAASLFALSFGLDYFSNVKWSAIIKGTFAIAALGLVLGLISLFDPIKLMLTSAAFIILSGSFIALSYGLDMFSKLSWISIVKGIIGLGLLGITLGAISFLFGGDKMIKAATGLLIFSAALAVFAAALLVMNYVNFSSILKMFAGMILIMPIFTALMLILSPVMVVFGVALWLMSYALSNFADAVYTLAKALLVGAIGFYILKTAVQSMSWEDLAKVGVVIVGLAAVLIGLNYALKAVGQQTFYKTALALAFFGMSLIPLAIGLKLLQYVGWESLAKGAAAILGFGLVAKLIGKDSGAMVKAGLGFLAFGLGLIPFALGVKMFSGVSLGTVMVAALAVLAIGGTAMFVMGKNLGSMMKAGIALASVGIGFITFAIGLKMMKNIDRETVLNAALALIAIGGTAMFVMGKNLGSMMKAGLALASVGIGLIPFALGVKMFSGLSLETVMVAALAVLAIGGTAMFVMGKNLGTMMKAGLALASVGIGLAAIGLAMLAFSGVKLETIGIAAAAIILVGGSAALAGRAFGTIIKGALGLAAIGVALLPLAIGMAVMSDIKMETILITGAAILLVGGAAAVIGTMGLGPILKGALGLAAVGIALLPLAIGMSIMSEVTMDTILVTAAAILLVGGAAALIGTIGLAPILMGALGLAALGIALIPLAIGLNMLTEVGYDTIGVLALALLTLTAAALVMGFAAPVVLIGALALAALGVALIPLAFALDSFKGTPLKELASSLYDFGMATALMGILSPLILLGSAVLLILGVSVMFLGFGLYLGGEYLESFNKTLVVFGDVAVKIIGAVGDVFSKFAEIISTTGLSIGYVIDKIKDLADPTMAPALLLTATAIGAVAVALGALLGGGAVVGAVGSVVSMVGGFAEGIGNFFAGTQGGALNAVQTLALIVRAAEYVSEIGKLSSEIDKLSAALTKLAQSPPINSEVLGQMDQLIQKAEKLSEMTKEGFWDKFKNFFGFGETPQNTELKNRGEVAAGAEGTLSSYGTSVEFDSASQDSNFDLLQNYRSGSNINLATIAPEKADYASLLAAEQAEREKLQRGPKGGLYEEKHTELLQNILTELRNRDALRTQMNQYNTSTTNVSGSGGAGTNFIPITTSSNRDSTWKATQGSLRPLG